MKAITILLFIAGIVPAILADETIASLADAYVISGLKKDAAGDRDGAIKEYTSAIASDSKNARATLERGILFCLAGRYKQSIHDLSVSLILHPNDYRAHFFRGAASFNSNNLSSAKLDLQKAIELKSGFGMSYSLLGVILMAEGKNSQAIDILTVGIKADPALVSCKLY